MPRKSTRRQINATVTQAQYAVIEQLAGEEGIAAYLRRLVAEDARARGVYWPALTPRGKYERTQPGTS